MPTTGKTLKTSSSTYNADMGREIPPSLDTSFVAAGPSSIGFAELLDDNSSALDILNTKFVNFIQFNSGNEALAQALAALQSPDEIGSEDPDSGFLIDIAKELDSFLTTLFKLPRPQAQTNGRIEALLKLKWKFVKRKGVLLYPLEQIQDFDGLAAEAAIFDAISEETKLTGSKNSDGSMTDECFGNAVLHWQTTKNQQALDNAAKFAAWAAQHELGRARYRQSVLFTLPNDHSTEHWLGNLKQASLNGGRKVFEIKPINAKPRQGFDLTEPALEGMHADLKARDQADYCLKCHKTKTDSCSNGLDAKHQGCPLHEKISEFLSLQSEGYNLGALAMIVRDNPMLAATGHRICNDCSQACVFQQQTPVDIPMAETQVLRQVLALSWGFEIYALLTRWNPLNTKIAKPKSPSKHSILVAGMGPAGFTLAHHLLQRGHAVIAIDGLKIQSLPLSLKIKVANNEPILNISQWFEPLGDRPAYGFGGVAEYGITSRWEKNFLTVIRLLLERRNRFSLHGDIRLGSSFKVQHAFDLGFSHVACALGAGAPKLALPLLRNALPVGVKTASDFLMALHTAGARKFDTATNLQIRMPIVVIGGGLTGVDAATEALAYYPVQVNRYAQRFENLTGSAKAEFMTSLNAQDRVIHDEFLSHAHTLSQFEHLTATEKTAACLAFLNELGGATLIYRKDITQSPAFQLNREELEKALSEGIKIEERIRPTGYSLDEFKALAGLMVTRADPDSTAFVMPAKCVLFAVGTQPNDVICTEEASVFSQQSHSGNTFEMAKMPDGRWISRVGDLHPSYAGSVVKAMASAKNAAPIIDASLQEILVNPSNNFELLKEYFNRQFTATVKEVLHHALGIAEIFFHAPAAAEQFKPGQFFRLQSLVDDAIEPLAMTGASANPLTGEISMVVLGMGASSIRAINWQAGTQVSLMGPTGTPSEIPKNKKVLLIGGGLGNAVLFSIGKAMRNNGCTVTYFAGYRQPSDVFTPERIEAAADQVVWCCDKILSGFKTRPNDRLFTGNIVQALQANKDLITGIDQLLVIGSDRMMGAVAMARQQGVVTGLSEIPLAIASINSPMQCMMKAICGQCLQEQRNKETGEVSYVFSCMTQDQNLDCVSFGSLTERLSQNRLTEQLSFAIEKSDSRKAPP
jgi:NADPH-dependent glutamate synthase beta subunit-like oxidoreductase/NAD(P)H-flavin reductase